MPAKKDQYPNLILHSVTMSAADTLTFDEINVGLNIFQRSGLIISRIEYFFSATTYGELTSHGDMVLIGVVASNQITSIGSTERAVLDKAEQNVVAHGTPASAEILTYPIVKDLSTLPGGGLLVPPRPLYLAMNTAGFVGAGVGYCRLYFTVLQLADADYFELLETFRFFE